MVKGRYPAGGFEAKESIAILDWAKQEIGGLLDGHEMILSVSFSPDGKNLS
jgi:hypothetical protein